MKKDYRGFKKMFMEVLQKNLGDGFTLNVCQVTKVNVGKLDALNICKRSGEEKQRCNFYLQQLFSKYEQGDGLMELVDDVVEQYKIHGDYSKEISDDVFDSYQKVKNRILFRVINTERNQELLSETPHREVLDMSIFYCVLMAKNEREIGTVRVDDEMAKRWGVSEQTLFEDARKNTAEKMPALCTSISQMLMSLLEEGGCLHEIDWNAESYRGEPVVLTNCHGINGFGSVFYEGVLEKISRKMGVDRLYILPSSLHESIIIPDIPSFSSVEELRKMVMEVNGTCVSEEDFLSDSVYVYQADRKKLEIAKEEEAYV